VRRASAVGVEQEQAQQAAPEFTCDLTQICLPGRSGRQLDRRVVAEEVVKVSQRFDGEEIQRKPDRPAPVGLPPKRPLRDSPGS
jgi:hypothetical protein